LQQPRFKNFEKSIPNSPPGRGGLHQEQKNQKHNSHLHKATYVLKKAQQHSILRQLTFQLIQIPLRLFNLRLRPHFRKQCQTLLPQRLCLSHIALGFINQTYVSIPCSVCDSMLQKYLMLADTLLTPYPTHHEFCKLCPCCYKSKPNTPYASIF